MGFVAVKGPAKKKKKKEKDARTIKKKGERSEL